MKLGTIDTGTLISQKLNNWLSESRQRLKGVIYRVEDKVNPQRLFWADKQAFSQEIEDWRSKMRVCESSDNPLAKNPEDLDGTLSYGLWQFKIGTWKHYIKKYDLFGWQNWEEADWWNAIWSRYYQDIVIDYMLEDDEVDWAREFPWCIKKHGLPPL